MAPPSLVPGFLPAQMCWPATNFETVFRSADASPAPHGSVDRSPIPEVGPCLSLILVEAFVAR